MHNNLTTNTKITASNGTASVLATLRALLPQRRLRLAEALQIAEFQADRLLRLRHIIDLPVPIEVVTGLPRMTAYYDPDLPRHAASGSSAWDSRRHAWVISVNPDEPTTRQRFTVVHEYKHIIDHYHAGLGGYLPTRLYRLTPVEYIAEYFAGCVLMPRRWVRAAFYGGMQHPSDLAELFDVSERAMEVRLSQLGLTEPAEQRSLVTPGYRLQPRPRRQGGYYRSLALTRPFTTVEEVTV